MTKTIEDLYAAHEGKLADKWALYLREYQRILAPRQRDALSVLEIGVQNGGSLELWAKWFTSAEHIVGCDINSTCGELTFDDPRIKVVVGNAGTEEAEREITRHVEAFDIVIDDGSHKSGDVIRAFWRYFPRLKDGGIYLIEDLHCSYWKRFEGGLFDPGSSMAFLKRLADVVNHEHWGVSRPPSDALRFACEKHGVAPNEQVLAHVHSLEFVNSMCVVRKAIHANNLLGERRIVGELAPVEAGTKEARGMARREHFEFDQSGNEWSTGNAPEDELPARKRELAERTASLTAESAKVRELEASLELVRAQHAREVELLGKQLSERDASLSNMLQSAKELDIALSARGRQIDELNALLAQSREGAEDLQRKLGKTTSTLNRLRGSVSWRVTEPIRLAGRLAGLNPVPQGKAAASKVAPAGGFYRARRRVRKVIREKGVMGATSRFFELATGRAKLQPFVPSSQRPKPQVVGNPGHAQLPHSVDYVAWLKNYDTMTDARRAALRDRAASFAKHPLISIVMPTYNTEPKFLALAIESVRRQIYPHWELCVADDASPNPEVRHVLEQYARLDPRIKVVFREENGHISAASNSALEIARGEWIALLDHDDELTEHALFWVVEALNRVEGARLLYSDEDKIRETGERCDPYFKCDWNEDLFRSHNMFSHLGVFDAKLVREVGGFRLGFEGSQDWDLVWRCVERVPRSAIHHIPRVLYSWRIHDQSTAKTIDTKPYAVTAGQRAMQEHFDRTGVDAVVEGELGGYRVTYRVPRPEPLVSIIIPTRNGEALVRRAIDSIVRLTTYENYEILVIDNGSDDPGTLRYLKEVGEQPRVRVIRDDRPFNYSALNNSAVQHVTGEFICLLNDDVEVITPEWLSEMVGVASQPGVGAVGARLWYPDDTLQHGGIVMGMGGVANYAHRHIPRGKNNGYFGRAMLRSSFSVVTAACLVIRRKTFLEVGGLNEVDLQIAYNDVDFCLRLVEAGYRNVYTPYAELYHFESATRGAEDTPEKKARFERESEYVQNRWAKFIAHDPAYSPNLSAWHVDFSYAWPPRLAP